MGRKKKKTLELYTDEQIAILDKHIEKYFGECRNYFSEKVYDNIKLNINVIPPDRKRPYYTLVTTGMGAHKMNVPSELKDLHFERAELVIYLPPNWDLDSDKLEYFWPLKLLSLLSRLPIEENTWIGWGHTVNYGTPFADNTDFCGAMVIDHMIEGDACVCSLDGKNDNVNFYQVIPLYESELDFKVVHRASALLSMLPDKALQVVDIDRPCYIPKNFYEIIDTVEQHSKKIEEKNLDILEINSANHICAFLCWFMEHDMLNDESLEFFAEDIEQIKSGGYDIRKFLINSLGGELTTDILTEEGGDFAHFYYDFYCEPPSYPSDVDKMAEEYFGTERYESDEFSDEAYLFVPFGKDYISAMYKYIDKAYADFLYFKEHDELPDEE
ncbi:MAG: suppressor of fused domain protein [Ruminococcus flavefaciens]|nr:suppressor of fused domain protein [Ruminococcus flavefaciens]MCM1229925.1 suppressor of fused domain protein [Ruminococcus flavefaciens]